MEMHQARYYLAACGAQNFTRAAESCNVSQPALTLAMKKLEGEFGGALFQRDGKRMRLTELGARVRPFVQGIMDQAEAMRAAATDFRLLHQAPLQIGVQSSIGPLRLTNMLSRFKLNNPGVELAVQDGTLDTLQTRLELGKLDLAVLHSPKAYAPGMRTMPLYKERYVVVMAPGHPFEQRDTVSLADTTKSAYVDRLGCEMRETVMAACAKMGIELYASFRSEREDWVQGMVMGGMGFAFMPECSVTLPGLLRRPLVDPSITRQVSLVHMAGRKLSPAAQAFTRAAQSYRWGEAA